MPVFEDSLERFIPVVLASIEMRVDRKTEEAFLKCAKSIGQMMFWCGSLSSVILVAGLAPFIVLESIQQNPTNMVQIYAAGFIAITLAIVRISYVRLKRRKAT